jgi:hypothetical protein
MCYFKTDHPIPQSQVVSLRDALKYGIWAGKIMLGKSNLELLVISKGQLIKD